MSDSNQPQHFNGINAVTGDYGLTLSAEQFIERVLPRNDSTALRRQQDEYTTAVKDGKKETFRGVREGVDGTKLEQAGWGLLFASADPRLDAIQEALSPLLALRKAQAGPYYRVFTGPEAYRPNESKSDFLRRFNIGAGAVDPKKGVPYYLLLIGGPTLIPYEFQYQLDVQFAVGRLDFDTVDEYANYAKAVVAAETGQQQLARTATFFSVTNAGDSATATTDAFLVKPLVDALIPNTPHWEITTYRGREANRRQLSALLGGAQKPAVLFTASHGVEFPLGDPRQERQQGALLCDEWPGREQWPGPLREEFYFAGDHLADTVDPSGLIAFHFACYGGGTPQYYDFERPSATTPAGNAKRKALAERPFVAHLPKKLLGHPKGGALAVVSHVDRAWSYSYQRGRTAQTTVFEDALKLLFAGQPLGWALEHFNSRYAELAADLSDAINRLSWGAQIEPYELAVLWTENHDARNYIVLGDPAVRVAVAGGSALGMDNRPAALPRYNDGRPVTISVEDWQQTPLTVKSALTTALQQIDQLTAQLAQNSATAPGTPPPVFRDGGRASGAPLRSAPTRGGVMRDGGTLRGGATRSWPPPDDGETKR